jgi:hypothetical protein
VIDIASVFKKGGVDPEGSTPRRDQRKEAQVVPRHKKKASENVNHFVELDEKEKET